MIRDLELQDVGPARDLKFRFAPRLNVLTGDNGLGKTFVLDVVWWLLTGRWADEPAYPWRPRQGAGGPSASPKIAATLTQGDGEPVFAPLLGEYLWDLQQWLQIPLRPAAPSASAWSTPPASLVVCARIDGTFAVWDAYQAKGSGGERAAAVVDLDAAELWEGKDAEEPGSARRRVVCRGLLEDWVTWQGTSAPEFESLRRTLHLLSEPDEPLVPGAPTRVRVDDRRDIPTLDTAYGQVPVTLASAGVRRVLGLAYVLVWAWSEHAKAAKVTNRQPTRDMVVLLDEVELHLHPRWQRTLLPAVLQAIASFAPDAAVQVLASTHAPLVLASLEPVFDDALDALFTFDLMPRAGRVKVERAAWRPLGDASNWLTSHVFDLGLARSLEAERAILDATRALDDPAIADDEAREIHRRLHDALGDTDPFWARWLELAERKGIEP